MNEHLLQYLWNHKILLIQNLRDTDGNEIEILHPGTWNHNDGPDFRGAKIKFNNLIFAGDIELHIKSSDWLAHKHSGDPNFSNLILHVVFHHDRELEDFRQKNIPTVVLENYINPDIIEKYDRLFQIKRFIPCEEIFTPEKIPFGFAESSVLKKLSTAAEHIMEDLSESKNDFEAVMFRRIAYAFGLKINAEVFKNIAESTDYQTIRKISQNKNQLEAFFFGKAGWLDNPQDEKSLEWQTEFNFLTKKYSLKDRIFNPNFLRLRPPNFPTIRLSQLADLYSREQNLFSKIINAKSLAGISALFAQVSASAYWDNHFTFGKTSEKSYPKILSKDFINLIIINAVLPVKYAFMRHKEENTADEILNFFTEIQPEKNSVTENWSSLGVKFGSALDSQAWLFHYKNFCEQKNCLNCSIGYQLLKSS